MLDDRSGICEIIFEVTGFNFENLWPFIEEVLIILVILTLVLKLAIEEAKLSH